MDELVSPVPAVPVPTPEAAEPASYKDDDLVYVDPKLRIVVARVEWTIAGKPKSLPMKMEEVEEEEDDKTKGKKRPRRQRFYPWGTYRSMKRIYKLEGKQPRQESQHTLDQVIEKALKEPFWD